MRLTRAFGTLALLIGALTLAACRGPAASEAEPQSLVDTGAAGETARAPSTPAGPSINPLSGSPTPAAASAEVTPAEVTAGPVTFTLALQPARHMFDQAMAAGTEAAQQPQDKSKSQGQRKGSAVLGGGMLHVANNIDAAQNPPPDSAQGLVRHVVVQVRDTASGQLVPYLSVSMDVLLDGRPAIFDQALAPMIATDGNPALLYYGNNVKFPQRGTYQIFVRLQPHPLLGEQAPPAAQFNLTLQ